SLPRRLLPYPLFPYTTLFRSWIYVLLLSYNSVLAALNDAHDDSRYYRLATATIWEVDNKNSRLQQLLHNSTQTLLQNRNPQMYVVYKITRFLKQQLKSYKYHQL